MKYKILKAGDVRRIYDQVRPRWNGGQRNFCDVPPNPCDNWIQSQLVGWPILPADLFNAEFRRPL